MRVRRGRRIKIVGAPEGAEIVVDGEAWGRTPRPDPIPAEPGSHEVMLTSEGQEALRSTVAAPAGQVVELEASMQADAVGCTLVVDNRLEGGDDGEGCTDDAECRGGNVCEGGDCIGCADDRDCPCNAYCASEEGGECMPAMVDRVMEECRTATIARGTCESRDLGVICRR